MSEQKMEGEHNDGKDSEAQAQEDGGDMPISFDYLTEHLDDQEDEVREEMRSVMEKIGKGCRVQVWNSKEEAYEDGVWSAKSGHQGGVAAQTQPSAPQPHRGYPARKKLRPRSKAQLMNGQN